MKINNISTTDFNGKAKFLSGLKKSEKDFAKKILDFEVDGISNRKLLADKNFDMRFFDSKKNPSEDTLYLSAHIKYLVRKGKEILGFRDIQLHEIDIPSGVEKGANALRGVIEKIDRDIENRYPTQYNTWMQKMKLKKSV